MNIDSLTYTDPKLIIALQLVFVFALVRRIFRSQFSNHEKILWTVALIIMPVAGLYMFFTFRAWSRKLRWRRSFMPAFKKEKLNE